MKLITIIGPSGAGKDTAARILSELTNIPVLVSYTTRPMREGEQNGREHHFVPQCLTPKDQMLAYTVYGNYEYWVSKDQIRVQDGSLCEASAIYVIDEEGLRDLRKKFPDIRIISIYITASRLTRRSRGVAIDRMQRDDLREQFPLDYYDYRIHNNFSLEQLHAALIPIAESITQH